MHAHEWLERLSAHHGALVFTDPRTRRPWTVGTCYRQIHGQSLPAWVARLDRENVVCGVVEWAAAELAQEWDVDWSLETGFRWGPGRVGAAREALARRATRLLEDLLHRPHDNASLRCPGERLSEA